MPKIIKPHMPLQDSSKLEEIVIPTQRTSKDPLWKGPEDASDMGGITFSMLNRFLSCRERFRVHVLEGLQPVESINYKMYYGNAWHVCEEALAGTVGNIKNKTQLAIAKNLKDYCKGLYEKHPLDFETIDKIYNLVAIQFPIYVDYWRHKEDVLARTPLLQEYAFKTPYILPSGRVVYLRGKFDSVDIINDHHDNGTRYDKGIWIQENKTKSQINEVSLCRQLTFDLQTMIYLVGLLELQKIGGPLGLAENRILGVRYNIIRRPLSGGKGTIVQHKPSKSNLKGETKEEFYARVEKYIKAEPETYFCRIKCSVSLADIEKFKKQCLNPILEQLCIWYDVMRNYSKSTEIWEAECNNIHWRHPYGLFNVVDEIGSSDVDAYLDNNNEVGLKQVDILFKELIS